MANPSVKNGHIDFANELAEQLAKHNIPGQEWRILLVILRQTWGWKKGKRKKDFDWISISQFEEKTLMKRRNVFSALQSLLAKRLIVKTEKGYGFNQNYDEWVLAKRLTVLAKRLTPISQKANDIVSQKATYNRKKDTLTKDSSADALNSNEKKQTVLGRHLYALAIFLLARGNTFDNYAQLQHCIVRNTRKSSDLTSYSPEQVLRALAYAEERAKGEYDVTLETVEKKITDAKDWKPPPKYDRLFSEVLPRFEREKDLLLSHSSPLLCQTPLT